MAAVPGTTDPLGIRPAHLHVVDDRVAARVAAPAFDTLPPEVRAAHAVDPLSYLRVLDPPTDEGPERHRRALADLLGTGVFGAAPHPRFAWYRLTDGDHEQTALVAEVAIADYDAGRIVRHEHTRAEREAQLAAFQRAVPADASPVALAHHADPRLRALARTATAGPPRVAFTDADGVRHQVWTTDDLDDVARITDAVAALDRLYVTDGHHRLAAASAVAASARAHGQPGHDGPEQWLLAALFPADELRILPFHRAVDRPHDASTAQLLAQLAAHVDVAELPGPAAPDRPRTFTAWIDGAWYGLTPPPGDVTDDVLRGLDVSVLQDHVLGPALGVHEPRIDPRLRYVAGTPADVADHCRRTGALGFVVRATSMPQLMRVADADAVMPPKSTLFAPKVRAGVVLRTTATTHDPAEPGRR